MLLTSRPQRPRPIRFVRLASVALRAAAGGVAVKRLAAAAHTAPAVRSNFDGNKDTGDSGEQESISIGVVIPARDEATRIGPLLRSIIGAPGVDEVIVVDDQSSDGTAELARAAGACVVEGAVLPVGWAGKSWALQQGIEAASSEWIVTLDADTRPDPALPTAVVSRARSDRLDLLTVAGRFECPTPSTRWLHASMLTTLVYRFGPPGSPTAPNRAMANGQCMVFRRSEFLDVGAMSLVASDVVEDIALARRLAGVGWRVGFLDASDLLTVRMFESIGDAWSGWGRSLALPGVESRSQQLLDLAVIVLAQTLPLPRVLLGRGDLLDVSLTAARFGTLVGTRTAYDRIDAAYWLSPLADLASAAAIARGIVRSGRQTWRGRSYP